MSNAPAWVLVAERIRPYWPGRKVFPGFEKIPANRRLEAFRKDEEGWIEQLENIAKYVG